VTPEDAELDPLHAASKAVVKDNQVQRSTIGFLLDDHPAKLS
jgi:hypothetical protein